MGPLGVWRNIPFIALSKCSYKFPLWCLRKLYEKIIKKLHKLLWFTSNMLSNSQFYIIQVFTFPGKPPLFISASNIWAARPLLSLLIRWLVLFILVQWTANQLQGIFYTITEKVTPVIDPIKSKSLRMKQKFSIQHRLTWSSLCRYSEHLSSWGLSCFYPHHTCICKSERNIYTTLTK